MAANTVSSLPLKDIVISNTLPELVTRVAEIVYVLNHGLDIGGSGNSAFAFLANNATFAFGKTEGNLNVNSAVTANSANTANNATFAFGKSEGGLNVNSALIANNSTFAFGKTEGALNANSALTSNNSTFAFGKSESGLNVNSALTSNNATFAFGKTEGNLNVNNATTSGSVTHSLINGAFITGGSFNGSANVTLAVNATDAHTPSTIVARDASGFTNIDRVYGVYFNTTDDNSLAANVTYLVAKKGDDYHRSANAAAVQTFLGLQSAAYLNANTTVVANTVLERDNQGDVFGRYLNSTDAVGSGTANVTYLMGKFGDDYHRSANASKVATFVDSAGVFAKLANANHFTPTDSITANLANQPTNIHISEFFDLGPVDGPHFGIVSQMVGSPTNAGHVGLGYSAFKCALYGETQSANGGDDIIAGNLVAVWNSGHPNSNIIGLEIDIANLNADKAQGDRPMVAGMTIVSGGNKIANFALRIDYADGRANVGAWRTGIEIDGCRDACLRAAEPTAGLQGTILSRQLFDGSDALLVQRFTDTSPTGTLIRGVNANNSAQLFSIDQYGAFRSSNTFYERGRTVAMGEWQTVTFNAASFTATTGTWNVASSNVQVFAYALVGKIMTVTCGLDTTNLSANTGEVRIDIPGGFVANYNECCGTFIYFDAGLSAWKQGVLTVSAGLGFLRLFSFDFGTTNIHSGTFHCRFTVSFAIT